MDKNIELLYAKDAIFKMISQFCHAITDDNGNYYISDYCESALESAFTVLGIEDDNIELMKFCEMWEENNKKIEEILKTDTFTLNHDIVNLMAINDELRESCPHEYKSNGICIYCLTENKGE